MTTTATKIKTTKVFKEILQAWVWAKRRILLEGGTAASKTWSALQALIIIAGEAVEPLLISIVSESLPHLKRGAIRDFFGILDESPDNNPYWSKTEFTYRRSGWKGVIEFFGADDDSKVRGPRRDILFMNEGNNIPWETARGLDIRTSRFTMVDWNPVSEFWAHEYWKDEPENAFSHSTYLDAREVLPAQVVADIESYRDKDPNWWNIYGLGLLGKIEGLVHPYFEQVDKLPEGEAFYGLDYGFSQDPTVLVKNVVIGEDLYSQEMFYDDSGLTNDDIARKMSLCRVKANELIWADRDEPKSAEELSRLGFSVVAIEKAYANPAYGIKKVNSYKQHWTKESLNCIKEQRNFRYIKDRQTGDFTDKTTHRWSHGMSARRFALSPHIDRVGGSNKILVVGF